MTYYNKIIIFILLTAVPNTIQAQQKYPRLVLVQLRSEHNRMEALKKAHDRAGLEQVQKDAMAAKAAMVYDFSSNFTYCPVYYYIDTNAELIKQRRFDNILLDSNGNAVTTPVISSTSTDYVIVYYGYHIQQANAARVVTDSTKYRYDPEGPTGKGLVVLNDKFQQISYNYKQQYADLLLGKKRKLKNYYISPKFDIEYFPLAKLLDYQFRNPGKKGKIKKAKY